MTSVSDVGTRLSQQFMLRVLREQMIESQRESTSGKKSESIAGLGSSGASKAVAFRSQNTLLDTYGRNLTINKTRMDVMDKSLLSVTNSAREMMNQLREQLQNSTPYATILSDDAATHLKSVTDKLNTQLDGRFLFGGDAVQDMPFNNLAALNTNISAQVTAAIGNPATTQASFTADVRTVSNSNLGVNTATVTAGSVSFRASDNSDIDYTIKASGSGFEDILRGLSIVANLPQPTNAVEQANYWNMVNAAIDLLDQGATKVDEYQAKLGYQANNVESLITSHKETYASIEEYLSDVEDVDMAEAAIKFGNLKTQLETSYSIVANLKDLSLINYIR